MEVVGGCTRVPALLKLLTDFFGREPSRTLNAKETVARGCALQCAMLSPTFKVRRQHMGVRKRPCRGCAPLGHEEQHR